METAQTLYRLQQAELGRAESQARIAQIEASLQNNSAVEVAAATEQQAQKALAEARSKSRSLELEVQSFRTRLRNSQELLFSGKVSNPKELSSLQDEGESLSRRIAKLEDDLLEAMIAQEEAKEQHDRASENLAQTTAQREDQVRDLTCEQAELEQRIAGLDDDIAQIRALLATDDLILYDHLAPRKANRPVALLSRSNVCGACGVAVPLATAQQARERKQTAFCPSCERVLYHEA